jgi:hypothetical protein
MSVQKSSYSKGWQKLTTPMTVCRRTNMHIRYYNVEVTLKVKKMRMPKALDEDGAAGWAGGKLVDENCTAGATSVRDYDVAAVGKGRRGEV